MRIAYLECFSGMSGDMFLGALVDAGVPLRLLEETVSALGVEAKLEISRVIRSGISATKVDVWVDGERDMPREDYWAKKSVAPAPLQQGRLTQPGPTPEAGEAIVIHAASEDADQAQPAGALIVTEPAAPDDANDAKAGVSV